MAKRLAMTTDGRLTYCSATEENLGKGSCNHVGHARNGESPEYFSKRMQAEDILFNAFKGLHYYEYEEMGALSPKSVGLGEDYYEVQRLRLLESFSSERLREMDCSLSDTELILRGDKKDLERLSKSDSSYSRYLANEVLKGRTPQEFYFSEPLTLLEEEKKWVDDVFNSYDAPITLIEAACKFLENDRATFKD